MDSGPRCTGKRHSPPYYWNKKLFNKIYKKTTPPTLGTHPSMKSINVEGPSSFINNLVSHHNKYTKEAFSLWLYSTPSLKAFLFLAFQTVQNKYKGSASQKHPKHSKQSKAQLPHIPCLFAMEKKMINGLLICLAKITSICWSSTPLLNLVQC